ncbi:MAG: HAMP domain-containing sensor histidine kinase [Candidatus Staskawiczbacteria bacterium]|nr:HAMP domain-containing sensor histidine kinase [Candidatus Staskawiczbacteria bacterium]
MLKNYYNFLFYSSPFILGAVGFVCLLVAIIVLFREISRQKQQKEEAQKKFIELSEFNKVKETFLTMAAHQLKTPLTDVKWALECLLADKEMSVQNKQLIRSSRERIFTSMDIIDKMLKSNEMQLVEINVKELIKKITGELYYLADNNKVSLKLDYRATGNIKIKGDPETLHFAFSNVVDNAIRYSPKGEVLITVEKEGKFARIIVKDNGIGIDKTDQQFIFNKFYRAKNAIAIDPSQTGVGLYSTKQAILHYGGTITLHSNIGKGTTIVITMPSI